MVRRLGSLSLLGRCVLVALLAHLLMAVWMNRNKVHRMLLEAVAIEEDYEFFEVSVDGLPEEEVGFAIRKEESDTGGDRPPTLELTPPSLSSLRERLRERELQERPRQLDAEELLASKAETPPPEPLSRTLPELAAAVETPVEELLPALPEVLEDDALPEVESRPIELQEQERELRPELASDLRRPEPPPSELKSRAVTTAPTRSDVGQLASPREAERPLPRPELRESLAGFEDPLVVLAEEPRDTDSELSFEVLKEKTRPALEDAAADRSRPERALLASGKSSPRVAKLDLRRRSPGGPSVGLQRSALRPVDSEASERALPTPHAAEAVKVAAAVEAPLPALPEVSEDGDDALPAVETRPVELQEREQEKELRPELTSGPRRPAAAPSELKSRAVTVAPTRSDVGQLANPTEAERALPRPELRDAPAGFEEPLAVLPGEPRDTDAELSFAVLKEKTRIASEDATEGRSSAKRALFDSANPAPRAVRLNLRRRSPGGLAVGLQRSSLRPVDSEASERAPPTLRAGEAVKPVATVLAPNPEFAPRPAENDPLPGLKGRPAPSPDRTESGSDARESRLAGVAPMKSRMNRRSSPASPRRPLRRTTRLPGALERSDKPILPGEGSSEVATSDLKSKLQSLDSPPTSVSTPGVKLALPNKTENSSSFLPRIYQLRTRDRRMEALEKGGGSAATERAVEAGLAWLALHQSPDGRWSLSDYARHIKRPHRRDLHHFKWNSREERSSIGGSKRAEDGDTAATGLALLAFLGHADTHREAGPYQETVRRGLEWLLGAQKPNGDLRGGGNLYMHAVAAFALCEAYAFTRDPDLRGPSQRAINFTAKSQNPRVGGWRYKPYPDSKDVDTSVFGWMLMALKSGMLGRLDVDRRCLVRGAEYLDSVRMSKAGGRYAYQPGITRTSLAMTAQGFFCQTVLVDTLVGKDGHTEPGIERSSRESMDYLLANLPRAEDQEGVNFYYWYYGTLALFQQGGKPWKKWNRTLSRLLIKEQVGKKHGSAYGSWDPRGKRARTGGRVYSTALSILCLEVYYRYAPLKK